MNQQYQNPEMHSGRVSCYDGRSGIITSQFNDGRFYDILFLQEYLLPLPTNVNLCVGQVVQYNLYRPHGGGRPQAYNISVVTPQPFAQHTNPNAPWSAQPTRPKSVQAVANVRTHDAPCVMQVAAAASIENQGPALRRGVTAQVSTESQHRATNVNVGTVNTVLGADLPEKQSIGAVVANVAQIPLPGSPKSAALKSSHSNADTSCNGTKGRFDSLKDSAKGASLKAGYGYQRAHGVPQYAPPPPVPHLHLNMPYMDRAARQPLSAQMQRPADDPRSQNRDYENQRPLKHAEAGRHNAYSSNSYGRDRATGDRCGTINDRDNFCRSRDQRTDRYHDSDRVGVGSCGRADSRDRYYRSPIRHGKNWQRGIPLDHLGRKAAAVAVAHVRHRRRSSAITDLGFLEPKTGVTAAASQKNAMPSTALNGATGCSNTAAVGNTARGASAISSEATEVYNGVLVATAAAAATAAISSSVNLNTKLDLSLGAYSSDSNTAPRPRPDSPAGSQAIDITLIGSSTSCSGLGTNTESDEEHSHDDEVEVIKEVKKKDSTGKLGAGRKAGRKTSMSRSNKESIRRRSKKNPVEELERALARVAINAKPLAGARSIRLFCGHCGKEQEWDVAGKRARPLPDPSAPDGVKRTKDAGRVLYDAKDSICSTCGNMIMCNPRSATCIYCDCQLDGFRPTYWKCSNVDGTARKRVLTGAAPGARNSGGPSSGASTERTAVPNQFNTQGNQGTNAGTTHAPISTAVGVGTTTTGCPYSRTCAMCKDHDLRFRGRPHCDCPRFHGAIAGQVNGNRAGNFGWVNVH